MHHNIIATIAGIAAVGIVKGTTGSKSKKSWDNQNDKLLGHYADVDVAKITGCNLAFIRKRRKSLGLRPGKQRLGQEWQQSELDMLGVYTDSYISRQTGRPISAISSKRRSLGLPSGKQGRVVNEAYSPEQIDMMGTKSDEDLGRLWGVKPDTITKYRQRLGIPRFRVEQLITEQIEEAMRQGYSNPEIHEMFPEVSESTIILQRRKRNLSRTIPGRRWSQEEIDALGTVPDRVIADNLGISAATVRSKRTSLGIPTFVDENNEFRRRHRPWTQEEIEVVRNNSIRAAARILNRTTGDVHRKKREINSND